MSGSDPRGKAPRHALPAKHAADRLQGLEAWNFKTHQQVIHRHVGVVLH